LSGSAATCSQTSPSRARAPPGLGSPPAIAPSPTAAASPAGAGRRERARCDRHGIAIREEPVERLVGRDGRLARITFASGPALRRAALFFATAQDQRSDLPRKLGCTFTPEGAVATSEHEVTSVPGVYVAGDASHREQKVVVAAAEGTQAAIKIHESLWSDDLRQRADRRRR